MKNHSIFQKAIIVAEDMLEDSILSGSVHASGKERVLGSLRGPEAFYRSLFENTKSALLIIDNEGIILGINQESAHLFGYHPDEIVGKLRYDSLIAENSRETIRRIILALKGDSSNVPRQIEADLVDKDGKRKHGFAIIDPIPKTDRIAITIINISERKKMEKMLKAREKQLQYKVESLLSPNKNIANLSIYDLMEHGQFQSYQDMFAASHSMAIVVIDKDGKSITNPSNFPDLFAIIGETQKGRDHYEMFERMLVERALNSMGPVCEVFPGCGFIDAAVPVEIDGQYIATLRISHVFVTEIDVQKVESYANEIGTDPDALVAAARRMRGMKPEQFEEIIDLFSVTAEKLLTLSYHNLKQAVDITERTRTIQSLQESKEKYHELSKVLLGRFPAKQKDEFLSSLRDVTERKRLEHDRKKALDQIDYVLGQLLILNDSIRNPLTVIVAYADLMEDKRARQILLDQAKEIDIIINKLDQRCLESEKVREYLRKHLKDF